MGDVSERWRFKHSFEDGERVCPRQTFFKKKKKIYWLKADNNAQWELT
jgi:hypothetical protein